MAATGKTPILLYGSTTPTNAPAAGNLTNSSDGCEIAINVADKNLFFKDSTNAVNTVPIRQSSASSNGWLSSTDWSTFNSKQPAGTYVTSVTGTAPVVSSGGTTPAISMAAANGSTNGYLTSIDWTTFNNKAPAFTYTSNYIPYGQGTTTPTQSANLTFNGSGFTLGGGATNYIFNSYGIGTTVTGAFYSDQSQAWVMLKDSGTSLGHVRLGSESGDMVFWANNAEAGRWKNGNLVISTSGKGIDFSATAGTGTSELLADYEEGTWTPTVTSETGSFTTVTVTNATYTKVGRIVTVETNFTLTNSGTGGGSINIAGLPYTANSVYNSMPFSCRRVNDGNTLFGQISGTTLSSIRTNTYVSGIINGYIYTVCATYAV